MRIVRASTEDRTRLVAALTDIPAEQLPVVEALASGLRAVERRFDLQLASDLPPVAALIRHIETYRGKMLRPGLVMLCGMAASPSRQPFAELLMAEHETLGAVCEMVHMATLVHDDVLDEADTRRRARTVNRLHGNEAAVMLGDYLIASAYHLCSTLDSQRFALAVAHASMVMCAGELLQLHHRGNWSLDEPTYFEIVRRKTGALIATACELGAACSGAGPAVCRAAHDAGLKLGAAFQIQDDVLDLTGEERTVGKSVGKDLEKGKITLPLIHMLSQLSPHDRGRALSVIDACTEDTGPEALDEVRRLLAKSGSVDHARSVARRLVDEARSLLLAFPPGPARELLMRQTVAAVERSS